ncbi:MAG: PDZ domain-containing protein [Phycisphaerales bacterium]
MPQMVGQLGGGVRADAPGGIARLRDLRVSDASSPFFGVGQASNEPRVMLGVVMGEPDPVLLEHLALAASKAVVLERVIEGLPADKAGLKVKDIIIGFGDHAEPRSADDIRKVLAKAEPGKVVQLKVLRKGAPLKLDLKLEAFNGAALGRVSAPEPMAGAAHPGADAPQPWREFEGQHWAQFNRDHAEHRSHMERAHKAMEEAAELMARMEVEVGEHAEHAHQQASAAIRQAIEAMQQGDLAGMEIEEIRRFQQEAVERLRRDLADNQNVQRFWAERGPDGQGFALTFPGEPREAANEWAERMEVLESRLSELERNVERAMERLESRTEVMMERLIERLERVIERQEEEAHGRRGR